MRPIIKCGHASSLDRPKQIWTTGKISDIPNIPTIADMLLGIQSIKKPVKKEQPITRNAVTIKGQRRCVVKTCRAQLPLTELRRTGKSVDSVRCPKCYEIWKIWKRKNEHILTAER